MPAVRVHLLSAGGIRWSFIIVANVHCSQSVSVSAIDEKVHSQPRRPGSMLR